MVDLFRCAFPPLLMTLMINQAAVASVGGGGGA
jgi:hypothetical protein